MKKLLTFALAMVMCLVLAACGGPDKQPAMDAYNKASDAFNEAADLINQNPDMYDQEVFDTMNAMADVLNQHAALLESDQEISEEKLNEMIAWYGTVEDWVADIKTDLGL